EPVRSGGCLSGGAGARPAGASPKAGGRALVPARGAAQRCRLDPNMARSGSARRGLAHGRTDLPEPGGPRSGASVRQSVGLACLVPSADLGDPYQLPGKDLGYEFQLKAHARSIPPPSIPFGAAFVTHYLL